MFYELCTERINDYSCSNNYTKGLQWFSSTDLNNLRLYLDSMYWEQLRPACTRVRPSDDLETQVEEFLHPVLNVFESDVLSGLTGIANISNDWNDL